MIDDRELDRVRGMPIAKVTVGDDAMLISFSNGWWLKLFEAGQSCCELRYMVCDDNLAAFSGASFIGVDVLDAPNVEDRGGEHEVQFLHVRTSDGTITASNHNEHNGYYGGFCLKAKAYAPWETT